MLTDVSDSELSEIREDILSDVRTHLRERNPHALVDVEVYPRSDHLAATVFLTDPALAPLAKERCRVLRETLRSRGYRMVILVQPWTGPRPADTNQ